MNDFSEAIQTALSRQTDSVLEELRMDLLQAAVAYARIRSDWYFLDHAARAERDVARTRAHNAVIDAVNILCRQMAKAGMDSGWRDDLGDDRKIIGDFACQLHSALGISCR